MNPRRLNLLVNILKPHKLKADEDTGEEIVEHRHHHRKVPAMLEEVSGGTTRRGLQVEAAVSTVLTIRYIEDIEQDYQVELPNKQGESAILEIVSILDRDGHKDWLEIQCSKVV